MPDWFQYVDHVGLPLAILGIVLWYVFPWMAKRLDDANQERVAAQQAFFEQLQVRDTAREASQAAFLEALRTRDQLLKEVLEKHNDLIHRQTERLTEVHTVVTQFAAAPAGRKRARG
jgi:hypothetical protein